MRRCFAVSMLLVLATLPSACFNDGAEGDGCTLTRDCAGGLVCDNPTGMSGTCRKPGDVPARLDAAVIDAGTPDATADRAADRTPDSTADVPAVDAPVDAPAGDAGDAGAPADGGDGGGDGPDAPHDGGTDGRG
jgi:hypothetical protein